MWSDNHGERSSDKDAAGRTWSLSVTWWGGEVIASLCFLMLENNPVNGKSYQILVQRAWISLDKSIVLSGFTLQGSQMWWELSQCLCRQPNLHEGFAGDFHRNRESFVRGTVVPPKRHGQEAGETLFVNQNTRLLGVILGLWEQLLLCCTWKTAGKKLQQDWTETLGCLPLFNWKPRAPIWRYVLL